MTTDPSLRSACLEPFIMSVQQQQQQSPQRPQKQLIAPHVALSRFDAAVAGSEINYSPSAPNLFSDNGFEVRPEQFEPEESTWEYTDETFYLQFQFRICPQFRRKPQLPPVDSPSPPSNADIDQPFSLHVAFVFPAHNLIFNTYPALRPSYLLLTASSLHHQSSPLSLDDIVAARTALDGLSSDFPGEDGGKEPSSDYMLIYNCGRASGCSRSHKHMQLFPRPSHTSFQLFPDRPSETPANVPYLYDLMRHPPSPSVASLDNHSIAESIVAFYNSSLKRFRTLLNIELDDDPIPHNVIMTQEWTLVIPRRSAQVNGLSANAAGMMGLVWVSTTEELKEWKRRSPRRILGELGVKAEGARTNDQWLESLEIL